MGRSVDTLPRALGTLRFAVDEIVSGTNILETNPTLFCIRPKARALLRGHVKIAVIT